MRKLFLSILMMSICMSLSAGPLKFGVEWGGNTLLYRSHHFNYFSSSRYRVNDEAQSFSFHFNAYLLASAGMNVGEHFSTSINAGYSGLAEKEAIVPIFLRTACYPHGQDSDGMYCFFDLGTAAPFGHNTLLASVGTSYRVALAPWMDLDFLCGVRLVNCSPDIFDPDTGEKITAENIRMSTAAYYSVYFGIALSF